MSQLDLLPPSTLDAAPPSDAAPPRTEKPADDAARFFDHLVDLSKRAKKGQGDARARLARLRRCLDRRGVQPEAFREIGDALPPGLSEREIDAYLLVAALYALHVAKSDEPWYGGYVGKQSDFGASCRAAGDGSGSMDQRFSALLDARRADLPYRLRQAVALCAAKGAGVRYDVLLRDLLAWNDPGRSVQRRWAQSYWAPRTTGPTS
jgi:CRISPR system Cascade subunit CasB